MYNIYNTRMVFTCIQCNYKTDNKSNYNKHLKTKLHSTKQVTNVNINNGNNYISNVILNKNIKQKPVEYICSNCNKILASAPSLSRHKSKFCNIKPKDQIIDDLKIQILEMKNEMKIKEIETEKNLKIKELETQVKLLNTYIKSNNMKQNVNITVIKYAQENYPDAPILAKMDDYSCLEDDERKIVKALINHHTNGQLHKYLGDFIIKYYKKEKHEDQSVWNTDVSRLSYIIKEIESTKKSIWTKDKEGIKTKQYIIEPLLLYIDSLIIKYIDDYTDVNLDDMNDTIDKLVLGNILIKVKNEIFNTDFPLKIIKYITPYFYMDKLTNLLEN